jgi:hypothetical protein
MLVKISKLLSFQMSIFNKRIKCEIVIYHLAIFGYKNRIKAILKQIATIPQ